jgi:predicted nuclease of predicted toxin-antitoxin system
MANLYADEQFPRQVTELLRSLGHNVLTVQEAGNAGKSDEDVLNFATNNDRAVLTINRKDFFRLDRLQFKHAGIIACKDDSDRQRMAFQINEAVLACDDLASQVIRINRPQK